MDFSKYKKIILSFIVIILFTVCIIYVKVIDNSKNLDFDCSYLIDLKVNPIEKFFEYTERAEVINTGKNNTSDLYFNLYANINLPFEKRIKVVSVTDENGERLPYKIENEGTAIYIKLRNPLRKGEKTSVNFTCKAELSEDSDVFGITTDGEIHLPMFNLQLAVYDKNGWNIAHKVKNGDGRYSYVSDYSVKISVPSDYEAVCNSEEVLQKIENEQKIQKFKAEKRRDLIVVLHKNYIKRERIIGKTKIIGYFNKDKITEANAEKTLDDAEFAINCYNKIYGEYPLEKFIITNSLKPADNPIGRNMEYSGFITVSIDKEVYEQIIYHEVAHQWFYFLVGNNENTDAWLDEGFAVFSVNYCLEEKGEKAVIEKILKKFKDTEQKYHKIPLNINPEKISEDDYSEVCYMKGAAFLQELQRKMGNQIFIDAVNDYLTKYAYKNASSSDFIKIMKSHSSEEDIDSIIFLYFNAE